MIGPALLLALLQEGPRLTKLEEQAKFHPRVQGQSAAERMAGYVKRQRMKDASYFGGVHWRNVGPEIQGGRILAIVSPEREPDTVYVAYATGGLYRTKDEGQTWESLFDDQSTFGIGAIAVSPDGKTIWVGTGEANSQRTSYAGTGVYKSDDAGKTWRHVGLPESHHIGEVVLDSRDPNVCYVAVMGHLYSQNGERGLYQTRDGGKTWSQILKADDQTGAIEIALDPKDPNHLLCSLWDRDRRAWNFRESGPGSAVMESRDGGKTWRKVVGLPQGVAAGRTGLAFSPSDPNRVYAFVDNQTEDPEWAERDEAVPSGRLTARRFLLLNDETLKAVDEKALDEFLRRLPESDLKAKDIKAGTLTYAQLKERLEKLDAFRPEILQSELYRSDDNGRTWRKLRPIGGIGGYYWGKVFVNPRDKDEVWVAGVPLLRSRNGGDTWEEVAEEAHVDHHAVRFDPRDPRRVWIGNDGGLYLSYDGGKKVTHVNNLSVAQAATLAVDDKRPYNVIVGNQDNGTMRGPSTYVPGRSDRNDWTTLFGGDGSAIAVDPRGGGDTVYVAYQFGQHFVSDPAAPGGWRYVTPKAAKGEKLRFNWISPFIISGHQPDIVYCGSQFLHRSFDGGRKWEKISPDLTRNLEQGDVPYSTLKDVSESPLRFGLIYCGADDGRVTMTPDGGYQWVDVPTPQPGKWVSRVVASRHDVNVVYCAQNGYRDDDFRPYLWRSANQGKTWTSIAQGLPDEPINVVREDPKDPKVLYVGTDMGVYATVDGGQNWTTLHGAMPNLPVHDLVVQERADDLVAATHARGAYILPLKNLRRFQGEVKDAALLVFDLQDLKRRDWGYARREWWDDRPASEPTLDLTVFTRTPGSAIVRLKDKEGKLVKEWTPDLTRGFNALSLSLQLRPALAQTRTRAQVKTAEDVLKDPFEGSRAQYPPLGDYTLEISSGGQSVTKPIRVVA